MYSLFLDTHSKDVIIILFKDEKILQKEIITSLNKHSVVTMPTLKKVLENNNLTVSDINEIIVDNGPGSFTGIRIAVTIAKTMAYSLNIPIKVISSLKIGSISIDGDKKFISIEEKNGSFIGVFNENNDLIEDMSYVSKSKYVELCKENEYHNLSDIDIDYEKMYKFTKDINAISAHEVKPVYIKDINLGNAK